MSRFDFLIAVTALLAPCSVGAAPNDSTHADPPPYQLGQGLHIPALNLDVGGYLSLQYEGLRHREQVLSVHDLSLFVNKNLGPRWNLFTEMEIGDALEFSDDGGANHNPEFDIERLYADYRLGPAVTLRFGKFLTPVGRWNMIHADPLVWTVSRPLTATAAFARHASGAMAYGTLPAGGRNLDYWVFIDDTDRLDPLERDEPAFEEPGSTLTVSNNFNRAAGARALYHFIENRFEVGASYVHFESRNSQHEKNLYGLDFHWNTPRLELSGEAVYRTVAGSSDADERGAFLQAVVPIPHHLYLIGRREQYRATGLSDDVTINTFGITYRPRPPLSFKLEYRSGAGNEQVAPDGWLGSLAILF